jgi:hypothetical protein
MSYKVVHYFEDLQDFNHPYKVGDVFPRLGLNVTDDRLKELSSKNNKQGKPLIEKIKETKEDDFSQYMNPPIEKTEVAYTKTEINRMSTADLKKLAKENGIDDGLNGAEIKKSLINKFEL